MENGLVGPTVALAGESLQQARPGERACLMPTSFRGSVIEVEQLRRIYRERGAPVEALRGVDLSVSAGEMVGITGPSGSGKSTLLRVLGALDSHFDGKVTVAGVSLHEANEREFVRFRAEKIGFIFQDFSLMTHLTALENLQLVDLFRPAGSSRASTKHAMELLDQVGLADRKNAFPSELSGGQQQRVAIARALMGQPSVLLCDEPTGNLDMETGDRILTLIETTRAEHDITVLVVTHERHVVERMSREVCLRDGQIVPCSESAGNFSTAGG